MYFDLSPPLFLSVPLSLFPETLLLPRLPGVPLCLVCVAYRRVCGYLIKDNSPVSTPQRKMIPLSQQPLTAQGTRRRSEGR